MTDAAVVARRLIEAYDARGMVGLITDEIPGFDVDDAYDVLRHIEAERRYRGWRPVGRKIGFTNRTLWAPYGVDGPMWARIWDRTVTFAGDGEAMLPLDTFLQPRIEPEVVFKLGDAAPESDDAHAVLTAIEWMAAGFEVVQCPFEGWRFRAPDCTAAFGLHGALVVGIPTPLTAANRDATGEALSTFAATLTCNGSVVDRGSGANVLGSPVLALAHLVRDLAGRTEFGALAPGEIITTGTLTDAWPVAPGERWQSDYGSLGVAGLTLTFA